MSEHGVGRLAFLPAPGRVEIREYGLRDPLPGEVLLRTLAAGVCGSEVHIFRGNHPLKSLALGHEIVGEVVATGGRDRDSSGAPLAAGHRVTAAYFDTCHACRACLRGQEWLCEHAYDRMVGGPDHAPHFVGTHATHYYVSPLQAIFNVPDEVPTLAAAAANCALAQVVCAVDRAAVSPADNVVIQGAGGLGIYATALVKERGGRVIVMDAVADRLDAARRFGADEVISLTETPDVEERRERVYELTSGEGADVAIELAGTPQAVPEGIKLVRWGGRYLELGNVTPGVEVAIDIGDFTRRGAVMIPVNRYQARHLEGALEFLSRRIDDLPLDQMIDGHYPLDRIEQALVDSGDHKVTRAAVVFEA
jgi:L-iditol 2-dehydrogenase